jgi:hypothetical protein
MTIGITFYSEAGVFRNRVDCEKAFKNQLGPNSLSQNTHIKLTLRDRVDLRWKQKLESIIVRSRQFKSVRAKVYIDHPDFKCVDDKVTSFNFRNAKDLSNDIANYIITTLKGEVRNKHGVTKEAILERVKK